MSESERAHSPEMGADENEQIAQRKLKLTALREKGAAYPNDFRRDALAAPLKVAFDSLSKEVLEDKQIRVKMAGRVMTRRVMGQASFFHLQDMSAQMQIYVMKDRLPEGDYEGFKEWDLGDIVGVEGVLFKTKTNELTVKADRLQLLTKALRPLPDKFHGLTDIEQRYRQRYLDLIVNPVSRRVFQIRSQLIAALRHFLNEAGFVEVETPMMHAQPGGALARPFTTHHNALDLPLYLRVAPELYLKRLVVGGVEKVYEINRNFRNEGVSTRHNPEFTMLEFYEAYTDYHQHMDFTERLFSHLATTVLGASAVHFQGHTFDFSKPFVRMTVEEAILQQCPDVDRSDLGDARLLRDILEGFGVSTDASIGIGKLQMELFEKKVERQLMQPTFITEFPIEVSPLAKANAQNPQVADRFELYMGGQEIANGFSELNDPEDQARRFRAQLSARESGDVEAMSYDEDYIIALEHGLPPTAGEGIGIDRLAMIFADCPSIRDVILFPLLRKK